MNECRPLHDCSMNLVGGVWGGAYVCSVDFVLERDGLERPFVLLCCPQVDAQHCVWYGECGESAIVPGKKYNCKLHRTPPAPLPAEGTELLGVM